MSESQWYTDMSLRFLSGFIIVIISYYAGWWYALGAIGSMAGQTRASIAHKLRRVAFLLRQRIESRALLGIGGSQFQHVASLTESDIDIVIEVKRTRASG